MDRGFEKLAITDEVGRPITLWCSGVCKRLYLLGSHETRRQAGVLAHEAFRAHSASLCSYSICGSTKNNTARRHLHACLMALAGPRGLGGENAF